MIWLELCFISPPPPTRGGRPIVWVRHSRMKLAAALGTEEGLGVQGLWTYLAAWIPSQVDESLIRTRSFFIPSASYILINLRAFSICASLSNESLKGEEIILQITYLTYPVSVSHKWTDTSCRGPPNSWQWHFATNFRHFSTRHQQFTTRHHQFTTLHQQFPTFLTFFWHFSTFYDILRQNFTTKLYNILRRRMSLSPVGGGAL